MIVGGAATAVLTQIGSGKSLDPFGLKLHRPAAGKTD